MRWLASSAAALPVCGCASNPPAPPPASATPTAATSAKPVAPTIPTCKKRVPDEVTLLDRILDGLRTPEFGGYRLEHTQLYRYLPLLNESGVVTSITATYAKIGNDPVFAVTVLVRNTNGGMDAHLGFAASPCPDGDLALLSPLIPLGVPEATIQYTNEVPYSAAQITELRLHLGEPIPPGLGRPAREPKTRSFAVGLKGGKMSVLGTIDLDADLPVEEGIHRRDVHLFGTGWYQHGGGVSFLHVHHTIYDTTDLCNAKRKVRPPSPPQLRLAAHIDAQHEFATDPAVVGVGYVVTIPENQPPGVFAGEKEFTLRSGPTVVQDPYFDNGPPAQWMIGLFDSADAANARMRSLKYTTGAVYVTAPKEPSTIKAKRTGNFGPFACDVF